MNILQYIFVFIILLLGIVIVAYSWYYNKLVSRLNQVQKQNLYLRFHVQEKSLEKINAAKDKSMSIITGALKQADEIIRKTELIKNQVNDLTGKELEELTMQQKETLDRASKDLLDSFTDAIKHLEEIDINTYSNITKSIENVLTNEVKDFEKQLHDETIVKQNAVEQEVHDAFVKTQTEIEEYRKEKLAEINEKVDSILQKVTKDVIGKRLTFEDHKELIVTALKKAKEEMAVM